MKKDVLLGTAIGDIAGSRFEINNCKTGKNFVLLHDDYCKFTDDTVMTFAVAKALISCKSDLSNLKDIVINSMVEVGGKYINCGFGPSFRSWIKNEEHRPYGSYGNGASMRISPVAVAIKNIDKIKSASACITNVSHNHEDSIKGAEAVCIAIHMALNENTKEEIIKYIEEKYFKIHEVNNNLKSLKEIHINCVETVKQAMIAFEESINFEDAIRCAIALGGDSDTIGSIAGGIAAAYYGIPEDLCEHASLFLDDYLMKIHDNFYTCFK